ncbi:hypothetical protein PoB_004055600 [Plakobranchus ocellatus]|uniref:Uncharacterized protein n=1 Tax=Plakobranchus ocellatus TaxID=259542 RepID=A0AAV4ASF0_9GAST|nr:hypothetical protein PoB_004055600 [Plakobranchus ocellatus]
MAVSPCESLNTQSMVRILKKASCKWTRSRRAVDAPRNRVHQELASVISTAKGEIHPSSTSSTVFTKEGRVKKWHGVSITINTLSKGLLDGCDDWVASLNGKDTLMLSERQHKGLT